MPEPDRLPDGVERVRTTPELTAETVPAGLLRSHRIAPGVWGRLRVLEGTVTFVEEETGAAAPLVGGQTRVIPPEVPHHVELGPDARFVVEFHR